MQVARCCWHLSQNMQFQKDQWTSVAQTEVLEPWAPVIVTYVQTQSMIWVYDIASTNSHPPGRNQRLSSFLQSESWPLEICKNLNTSRELPTMTSIWSVYQAQVANTVKYHILCKTHRILIIIILPQSSSQALRVQSLHVRLWVTKVASKMDFLLLDTTNHKWKNDARMTEHVIAPRIKGWNSSKNKHNRGRANFKSVASKVAKWIESFSNRTFRVVEFNTHRHIDTCHLAHLGTGSLASLWAFPGPAEPAEPGSQLRIPTNLHLCYVRLAFFEDLSTYFYKFVE